MNILLDIKANNSFKAHNEILKSLHKNKKTILNNASTPLSCKELGKNLAVESYFTLIKPNTDSFNNTFVKQANKYSTIQNTLLDRFTNKLNNYKNLIKITNQELETDVQSNEINTKENDITTNNSQSISIISCLEDNSNIKEKKMLFDKISTNEKLCKNEILINNLDKIMDSIHTSDDANAKISFINKILSDKDIYDNKIIQFVMFPSIMSIKSFEHLQAKENVLDLIFNNSSLFNNDKLMNNLHEMLVDTNSIYAAKLLELICSDENIYNSERIMENIGNILSTTNTSENFNARSKIIEKLALNKELYSDEKLMREVSSIIEYVNNEKNAETILQILSNKKMYNDENIVESFNAILESDINYDNLSQIFKKWQINNLKDKCEFSDFILFIIDENTGEPIESNRENILYELIKLNDSNGQQAIILNSFVKKSLLNLPIEHYDLVKLLISDKSDFCSIVRLINQYRQKNPKLLINIQKQLKNDPDFAKYFSADLLFNCNDKVNLLINQKDLLKSFENYFTDDSLEALVNISDYKTLENCVNLLKYVPDNIKKNHPESLSLIFSTLILKNLNNEKVEIMPYIEFYNNICKFDKNYINKVIKIIILNNLDPININPHNIEIATKYIEDNEFDYDVDYVFRILNQKLDLTNNLFAMNEILKNKHEVIKQINVKCKDTYPNFGNLFLENYLSDINKYQELIFIPNLSTNTFINNVFETSKIFNYVNKNPQNYINGDYNNRIIAALKDFRQKDSKKNLYNELYMDEKQKLLLFDSQITTNMDNNFIKILNAISSTDVETVKLLLDKRFLIFEEKISEIEQLNGEAKLILSNLIRKGKRINKNGEPDKLSGQQKIDLIYSIKAMLNLYHDFNIDKYKSYINNEEFILDIKKLHGDIYKAILLKSALTNEEISKINSDKMNWNMNYISLLYLTPLNDNGEINDLIKIASLYDFNEYINNPNNKYGQTNMKTKQAFLKNKLDYEQWLRPNVKNIKFKLNGEDFYIKMWDRVPQEEIFLGSKTTCCTALDRKNGGSMAVYMLNNSFNIVELQDSNGNVFAMSRIFMANVDNKPTLIMDNIEINNNFLQKINTNDEVIKIRNAFFKYMNNLAEKITKDKNTQVMFFFGDLHVPVSDLKYKSKKIEFIGNIHRECVYLNAADCSYYNPQKLNNYHKIKWLIVPKENNL